jgi:hypothetical protein
MHHATESSVADQDLWMIAFALVLVDNYKVILIWRTVSIAENISNSVDLKSRKSAANNYNLTW